MKYHDSTVKQLMTSFYFNRYMTTEESTLDPHQMRAVSKYTTAADTWLDDNADLDPCNTMQDIVIYDASDVVRVSLLTQLNYKETKSVNDVHSGTSAIMGDGDSSGASSGQSETSKGWAMGKTLTLKLQLAKANSKSAAQDQTLSRMQAQINQLLQVQHVTVSTANAPDTSDPSIAEGSQGP